MHGASGVPIVLFTKGDCMCCRLFVTVFVLLVMSTGLFAQDKVQTSVIGRMAVGKGAYHYTEVYQSRGKWIFPDVGYIDFNSPGTYREFYIGGGAVLYSSEKVLLIQEGFLVQAFGPDAGRASYAMPWTYVRFQLTSRVSNETVYFPYIPLNKTARVQQVLERSKTEYDFKHWKLGVGYSGYQFAHNDWQHKPFVSATLKAGKLGNFELWLQRVPDNHPQVQLRYAKTFE